MTTFIAFSALGSVVVFSLSFLFCAVVVFFRPGRNQREAIEGFTGSQILSETQRISARLGNCIAKIVGRKWWDFNTTLRLIAFYWILLPTLAMMFMIGEEHDVLNSIWVSIGMNLWIWANIVTDYVSLNVTRDCLNEYRLAHQPTRAFIGRLVVIDLFVAAAMIATVILGANAGLLICRDQDTGQIVANAWETIFSTETVFRPYSVLIDGKATTQWSGMIWISATSYIPTLLWAVGMTTIVGLMTLMNALRRVVSLSAERAWVIACSALLLASVAGIIQGLSVYHSVVNR